MDLSGLRSTKFALRPVRGVNVTPLSMSVGLNKPLAARSGGFL
jgi:hypothetical protein